MSRPATVRKAGVVVLTTALTLGMSVGMTPAFAAEGAPADDVAKAPEPGDKLGSHDRELLAQAESAGEATVTIMVSTRKGAEDSVAGQLKALGGRVGKTLPNLGYVRATLPTGKVLKASAAKDIRAVDLNESVPLPDVREGSSELSAAAAKAADRKARKKGRVYGGPDAGTPDDNPYLPTNEIGAVQFKQSHATWDGRGVTIGILDSGVDLDNPALQTTSTGERKIVDWVTSVDPLLEGDLALAPHADRRHGPLVLLQGRDVDGAGRELPGQPVQREHHRGLRARG